MSVGDTTVKVCDTRASVQISTKKTQNRNKTIKHYITNQP